MRTFLSFAFIILASIIYIRYLDAKNGLIILYFFTLLPLLSVLITFLTKNKIEIELDIKDDILTKNHKSKLKLMINKKIRLPIPFVSIKIQQVDHFDKLEIDTFRISMSEEKKFKTYVEFTPRICGKTEIISNAPLLSEFYDKYQDTDKGNIVPSVCHVGGLTYSRGITHLIKAAYKANVKLILGGRFSPANYETEVKQMPEYSSVDYRGHLTRGQILKVHQESTIGAATILNIGQYNTGDNFATKVYEYMSMGLPVIITKYPYAEKMIQKYDFGIAVEPDNVDEIADAIMYLIDNPDKAKEMGENGRRAIWEEFNWGIEEKKLISLYRKLEMSHGVHAV